MLTPKGNARPTPGSSLSMMLKPGTTECPIVACEFSFLPSDDGKYCIYLQWISFFVLSYKFAYEATEAG